MDPQDLMYTSITRMGAVVVLRPTRRLLGGEESDELQQLVRELNTEEVRCLVINLAEADFVNSMGLSVLFDAHQRFAKRGACVHLARLDTRIQHLLSVTKLSLVFDIYPTEEAAIAGAVDKQAPLSSST